MLEAIISNLKQKNPRLLNQLANEFEIDPETGKEVTALHLYLRQKRKEVSQAFRELEKSLLEEGHHPAQAEMMASEWVAESVY